MIKITNCTQIRAAGYDSDTGVLSIEFDTGSVYEYASVSESEFLRLIGALDSLAHFERCIKGKKPYKRVKGPWRRQLEEYMGNVAADCTVPNG